MAAQQEITVVAADIMRGDVLVHFSDGASVLFRASYLSSSRSQGGNYQIPPEVIARDEVLIPSKE